MQKTYSQLQAMLAISKASLKAIVRSPSAVVFSIAFPLVFILVFGLVGGKGNVSFQIAFDPVSDTNNTMYYAIKNIAAIKIISKPQDEIKKDLEKGRLLAILNIQKNPTGSKAEYTINLKSSEAANPQNLSIFQQNILTGIISQQNQLRYQSNLSIATVNPVIQKTPGRVYRTIDFILPGQLGFSLLSSGVFGVAFLFFSLRQQLVLKRFYATPIKRTYIVLGEAFSRVIFQMLTAIIIISIGHFAFDFTLVHGFRTFFDIMILSFIALLVFMGFGFIISSTAKNESSIPPLANLFTLPQFLLAGTFFSIDAFPSWLQPICRILPLTHFNTAMRNIAFEGASLAANWKEIGVLCIWGIIAYTVAARIFKWE